MRVDVKKIVFIGTQRQRGAFFKEAQQHGLVEFISPKQVRAREFPEDVQRLTTAIKVLRSLPVAEQREPDDSFASASGIADAIIELHHRIEKYEEEKRVLQQEIARVAPFGAFSVEDVKALETQGNRVLQFFAAKKHSATNPESHKEVILVHSDHGLDYFVAINDSRKSYEGMIEMHIPEPVNVLERRYREIDAKYHETHNSLKTYAVRSRYLHQALIHRMNHHNLQSAEQLAEGVLDDGLFAIQGWVAEDKIPQLNKLVAKYNVHWEQVATESSDRVPTCLENTGFSRVGEDLVHVYDTPSTNDKDPSIWVLWSFSLFFAMIIGDAGYGTIFLLSALYLRFKFGSAEGMGRRMITLAMVLSISTLLWGLTTHSFFGIDIPKDHFLRAYSPVEKIVEMKAGYHLAAKDTVYKLWIEKDPTLASATTPSAFLTNDMGKVFLDNLMIEMALFVGSLHVMLSFLRNLRAAWTGIGWVLATVGAYLYFPIYLDSTSLIHYVFGIDKAFGATVGQDLLLVGIVGSVVIAIFLRGFLGIFELLNVISVFADVLSYLRLYALGLSGSMMSATFNEIGMSMPLVAGVIMIVAGHAINIVLSIMGGVIHGLRLNFLEWYHYCFEGGGTMFNPLSLQRVK